MKTRNKALEESLTSGLKANEVGTSKDDIKASFLEKLFYGLGRVPKVATHNDLYTALALCVRDRIFRQFVRSTTEFAEQDARGVAYLSAEYLPGPHLAKNLLDLGLTSQTREALAELDINLDKLLEKEEEPGLGNGGLGRLASCYMDAMATRGIPAIAYGIRYEFGIFKQEIKEGWQVEVTDKWLHNGNPWEIARPEISYEVKFGGQTESWVDRNNKYRVNWKAASVVKGTAFDTPILGYQSNGIIMRLWKAEAVESFDFAAYNLGDYYKAVEKKIKSENITKVLYPNDENLSGKELRLMQQYFFVSCSLQNILHIHKLQQRSLNKLYEKFSIQLNDTHPSIAVAELMRLLVDEHNMEWEEAWQVTEQTFAYTNHTLLPEALERWPVSILSNLLPRHMEIIYEINRRFLETLREKNYSGEKISRMSLIEEGGDRLVRMAHLATIGSYKVNGVSALHSGLLKKQVLHDFAELWPDKFTNVTNGISHRRFLGVGNPALADLISGKIGDRWLSDLNELRALEKHSEKVTFQKKWRQMKLNNKKDLCTHIQRSAGIQVDPNMMFDVQVKRIHEYKRQHLKVLHILSLYHRIKKGEGENIVPTAFIFAGKAAPGYFMAKLIIRLINAVAYLVNNDEEVNDKLKVAFIPNFNVKQAQKIYAAADLSEQISMAGKEASGTGNMKFALNGALTVGTLDGANVEIREEVGEENFFLFGQTTEEVQDTKAKGYHPYRIYEENGGLREVIDFLVSEKLTGGDVNLFRPIYDNLLQQDQYQVLKDYQSYIDCQEEISAVWRDPKEWTRRSILNVARIGKFSSDRSIRDYAEDIWKANPVKVD